MTNPRVFVSYDPNSPRGTTVANQLQNYLQSERFEVSTSGQTTLNRVLGPNPTSGQWVVLVRTTYTTVENSRPYKEASDALDLYMRGQLQGVLAIAWSPTDSEELASIPPQLSAISTYDVGSTEQEQTKAFEDVTNTIGYSAKTVRPVVSGPLQQPSYGQNGQVVQGTSNSQAAGTRRPSSKFALPIIIALAVILIALVGFTVLPSLTEGKPKNTVTPTVIHNTPPPTVTSSVPSATVTLTSQQAQALYDSSTKSSSVIDPIASDKVNWDNNDTCSFQQGAYIITTTTFQPCMWKKSKFKDFAYEVKMSLNKTGVAGGLIFRSDASKNFYRFSFETTGKFNLFLCNPCKADASGSNPLPLINENASPVTSLSSNVSVALTVIVKGSFIYLYIGTQYVAQVQDTSLSSGEIGLYAGSRDSGQNTTATFTDLKVWNLI